MKLSRQTLNPHSESHDNTILRDVAKGTSFFSKAAEPGFFSPATHLHRKCEECEQEDKLQRMSYEEEAVQKKDVTEEEEVQ
jgi:hypothetical protein